MLFKSLSLLGVPLLAFIFQYNLVPDRVALLEIPEISLKQELYSKDDSRNDLDKNIIFLSSSSMPNEKGGNVIIAGHNNGVFKNLYRLKVGNNIYLNYSNKKYKYEIVKIYKVLKNGKAEIIRDPKKKSITLITCHGINKQLIIVGEQKNNT